jgi:hypothetical protein
MVDYNPSALWAQSPLHAFVVGHDDFRERFEQAGVASERVLVAGPPIQRGFERELDRDAERQSIGLANDLVCLVRAEAFAPALMERIVFQCSLVKRPIRFVFHHNGDGSAASLLRRVSAEYGLKAVMFGKVPDLERYVLAADFVIAAPSDAFVAELVALDRPLLFVGADDSAAEQIDFLTRQGAARWVDDVLRLGSEIDTFSEADALSAASEAGARLSRTTGNRDVADALAVAVQRIEDWRAAPEAPEAPAPDDEDDAEPLDDAFESIGGSRGGDSSATREETPGYQGISQAAAKEELASLILSERDLERRLEELERQQERWRNRLELAREWNEDDLAEEASEVLRGYVEEARPVREELMAIRRQKEMLKGAAHGRESGPSRDAGAPQGDRVSELEERFRRMEVDSDLEGLKDRIRRELGE